MCGIGGWLLSEPSGAGEALARAFLGPLRARGPDDEGVALVMAGEATHLATERSSAAVRGLAGLTAAAGRPHTVGLVNTRFAIVDTSVAGHQPLSSADGRVISTFNGEIYNHDELRRELVGRGVRFRGHSDTEVLVEGYRAWGDDLWARLNGFWAAALYDLETRVLTLSRDRFGIVPLYVRRTASGVFFSSLLEPLVRLDPGGIRLDLEAARRFVDTEVKDDAESTFFLPIQRVAPATALHLRGPALDAVRTLTYWDFPEGRFEPDEIAVADAARRLRELLVDAVALRLRADVPVALELSGGLDSSSIVAAAALAGADPVTYTLRHPGRDEEPYARTMRRRHRLDYRVVAPDHGFARAGDAFLAMHEEPYHAPNAFTHYLMRRVMRADGYKVALAGSGGDELLAGYEFDFWPSARRELREDGHGWSAARHDLAFRFGTPARALAAVVPTLKALRRRALGRASTAPPRFQPLRHRHFRVALLPHYLTSDDRYSMAIPVEHRLPFLDHRIVEFGFRLRAEHLFRAGWSKYVLRRAMAPHLPREIAWRRVKMGFPLDLTSFLAEHRARLGPDYELARARLSGLDQPWDELAASDSQRAWRAAVTGTWLRWTEDAWGLRAP